MVALGPDGPLAFATRVSIDETDGGEGQPHRLVVRGRSESLDLTLDLDVRQSVRTGFGGDASPTDFLQLRGRYRVSGEVGGRPLAIEADGAAETFRGVPAPR